jgi:hypothetical protein
VADVEEVSAIGVKAPLTFVMRTRYASGGGMDSTAAGPLSGQPFLNLVEAQAKSTQGQDLQASVLRIAVNRLPKPLRGVTNITCKNGADDSAALLIPTLTPHTWSGETGTVSAR